MEEAGQGLWEVVRGTHGGCGKELAVGEQQTRTAEQSPPSGPGGWDGEGILVRGGVFVRPEAVRNARHEY